MKLALRVVAGSGVSAVVGLLLYPPYMVIDPAAPRVRHAALGHWPAWNPPGPAIAEELLTREVGPPVAATPSPLSVRVNRVRLGLELFTVVAGVAAVWLALGRSRSRRPRPAAQGGPRSGSPGPGKPAGRDNRA